MEIAEETKGRGKTYTPDEYKKMRDEVKEEIKTDPDIIEELREDLEIELLSEQQHLVDEIVKHKNELADLQGEKATLQADVRAERQNFNAMQTKFQPRKDDLDKINKISRESKPNVLTSKVSVKEDWDFIINIAKQHAKISDTTLAALEKHNDTTEALKRCQSLYLAVASEVAALGYSDRSKIKHSVQDVLKDIVDWRAVSWLIDNMIDHKPSDLEEILKFREAKISKKYNYAKNVRDYNQPTVIPQKTKKKLQNQER